MKSPLPVQQLGNHSISTRLTCCFKWLLLWLLIALPLLSKAADCPTGLVGATQTGNATTATVTTATVSYSTYATGTIANAGTAPTTTNSALMGTSGVLTLDLGVTVPAGNNLILSLARNTSTTAKADIQTSLNNSTYQSLGTYGSGGTLGTAATTLARLTLNVPSGGIRYVRIVSQSAGIQVDGAQYNKTCIAPDDYGDAPDTTTGTGVGNYQTTIAGGGPKHTIIPGLAIGTSVDADTGTLQNANADADDTTDTDDDDGVNLPQITTTDGGKTYTITTYVTNYLENITMPRAYVVAYMDLNRDGDFLDAGEKSTTQFVDASTYYYSTFTLPATLTAGANYYVRVRVGQTQAQVESPTVAASSGEVEDYKVTVVSGTGYDFSDAPASYGDAKHLVNNNIYLGDIPPDTEAASQYSYAAFSDGRDEDGAPRSPVNSSLTFFPTLKLNASTYSVDFKVTNNTTKVAKLYAWIDFDKSGTLEADEGTSVSVPTGVTKGTATLTWSAIPSDIKLGTTVLRARFTTDTTVTVSTPTGTATDGEVEDYPIAVSMPVPANSPAVSIASGVANAACEIIVFQDNFNDLQPLLYWGVNRPGSQAIRNWDRSGGGGDTYARTVDMSNLGQGISVYFGNGAIREINPPINASSLTFDSNGKLLNTIDSLALRDDMDDLTPNANLGTITTTSDWGPDPVTLSRTFNTTAGKSYRLYFKAVPESGNWLPGFMRVDTPSGSIHFKTPGGSDTVQQYAIEFTANAATSTIAFVNYGHLGMHASGWCDPNSLFTASPWCTVNGLTNDQQANELMIDDVVVTDVACATGTISGTVFEDLNNNATYDFNTELGIGAIKVSLYDQNGTPNDFTDDRLVTTTDTASTGIYTFTNVNAARIYRIEVDAKDSDLQAGASLRTPNPLTNVTVAAGGTTSGKDFGFNQLRMTVKTPPTYNMCKSTSVEQIDAFKYATATGAGASGVPSMTYTAPSGSNRMMVVILSVERDHTPTNSLGDNLEINNTSTNDLSVSGTAPTVTFGGVPLQVLARSISPSGSNNTFATAEMSQSHYLYSLMDLSIPSGAQTIQVSGINLPTNAGDEAILTVATFANVAGANPVLPTTTVQQRTAPFTPSITASTALPTGEIQPPGTTAADNMLLAFGNSSKAEYLNTSAGWTKLAEIPLVNSNGTFASAAGRVSGPFTENDGHTLLIQSIKGVTGNQTAAMISSDPALASLNLSLFRLVAHGCDYGDAPISYGEATHSQSWTRRLGVLRGDAEITTPNQFNAVGDNNLGDNDEDGVTLPPLTAGQSTTINVTVAGAGYLSAWFDWNGDGDFADAGEKVASDLQDTNADGIIPITISVPSTATLAQTYARLRFSINTGVGPSGFASYGEVEDYAFVINPATTTSTAPLACNTTTPWLNTTWTGLTTSTSYAGVCGLTLGVACPTSSLGNIINSNTSDAAGVTILLSGTRKVKVADGAAGASYPAGTYAGFTVERNSLLSATVADSVKINTYNGSTLVESKTLPSDLIGISTVIGGEGPQTVGFVTNQSFNAVEIEFNLLLGTSMDYKIYNAVLKKYCGGSGLTCNTATLLNNPSYPTEIDSPKTGVSGLACAQCSVKQTQNAISTSTSDYANITLAASVGVSGSIAIKDALTDYPAGYFAGMEVENSALIDANLLSSLQIQTYLNDTLQETKSGGGALFSIDTSLFGSSGRRKVGFATTLPFDEIRLTATNLMGILNTTKVYGAVFEGFCPAAPMSCTNEYNLVNPNFPVIIDGLNTGFNTAACVGCVVSNPDNVIDSSLSNSATIQIPVSILAFGSIAVADMLDTFPAGSFAGFVIEDANNLINLDLLQSMKFSTYLNGTLQETKAAGDLIDLSILFPLLGQSGIKKIGIWTSKDFDEIKLEAGSLGSLLNFIKVYNAYVRPGKNTNGDSCTTGPTSGYGALTGTVYIDLNNNGVYDGLLSGILSVLKKSPQPTITQTTKTTAYIAQPRAGLDVGLPVMAVTLYDQNGTASTADDRLISTTTTDLNGNYQFTTLNPALTYRVQVNVLDPNLPLNLSLVTANPILNLTIPAGTTLAHQDFGFRSTPTKDFGDAPATYGEASHTIVSGLYLGTAPDAESSSKFSFNARADNNDDGAPGQPISTYIPLFPVLQLTDTSYSADFKVTNTTGKAAKLYAWIDFDKSGTFEADEATSVTVPTGSNNASVTLNWASIPLDIKLGTTAIRLRLTSDASVTTATPTGDAVDGEVEDYPIAIAMDIPPNSPSLSIVSGSTPAACETVLFQDNFDDLVPGTFWGANRADGQPIRNWQRAGGGNDTYAHITTLGTGNYGVYFGNGSIRQISPPLTNDYVFDSNGKLLTTIDAIALRDDMDDYITPGTTVNEYGSKADWGAAPVQLSRTFNTVVGKTYRLYFKAAPENPGDYYASGIMRLDTPGGSIHFKAPGSSEGVQQYAVEFTATSSTSSITFVNYGHTELHSNGWCDPNTVFNSNPWCTVGGTNAKPGNELIIDDVILTEAACSVGSISGNVYIDANKNNTYDTGETGLANITVKVFDQNGTPADTSDDRLVNTTSSAANGSYSFANLNTARTYRLEVDTTDPDLPAQATIGTTMPLINVAVTANNTTANQNFGFDLYTKDYGDAPATYGTPTHTIGSSLYLGANMPDGESAAPAPLDGTGDDTTGTDDEDGITLPTLTQGQTATINAVVNGAGGYLQGWIDWNGNGTFDTGEQVATNLQDNGVGDTDNTTGKIAFTVSVPATATTNKTYARFRWSTTKDLNATAAANDGEVEEYAFTIANPSGQSLAGKVWFDSNNDGIQNDGSDAYIEGTLVELYVTATSSIIATTTTNSNGIYQFSDTNGLQPSTNYQLRIRKLDTQAPLSNWSIASVNAGTDDALDSDAILSGNYWTIAVTSPTAGNTASNYGFGFNNATVAGCLDNGATGISDESIVNSHPNTYDFLFGTKQVTGYCAERTDSAPQAGDNYAVNATDRQSLTALTKEKLGRGYSALTDPDIIFQIAAAFGSGKNQQRLDDLMQLTTWFYVNWNENLASLDAQIDSNSNYTATNKTDMKAIARKVIDRINGTNSQTQYPIQNIFWLWNMTSSSRQDIVVPAIYTVGLSCATLSDHGDAPSTYGDPTHAIANTLKLGANAPDGEATAPTPLDGTGDDATGTDDEDGVTILPLTQGQTATINAVVNGAGGYLQGWIDWNGNGTFEAGEQVATNLQDNGVGDTDNTTGKIAFTVSVPATATTNKTYARFRWSTTKDLNATAAANDGEVEDYSVSIQPTPAKICTSANEIYLQSASTGGIYPLNLSPLGTGSLINTLLPTAPLTNLNATGYNLVNGKFYFLSNQVVGDGTLETLQSYDPSTNTYQTLAGMPGNAIAYRGAVTLDGTGYYTLSDSMLRYYNIATNTWIQLGNVWKNQNGTDISTQFLSQTGGDIAFDGLGNLWILTGSGNSPYPYIVYKLSGPVPTTPVNSLTVKQLTSGEMGSTAGQSMSGIAFSATGEVILSTQNKVYKLNNDYSISYVGDRGSTTPESNDLTSCNFPTNPLGSADYGDAPDSYKTLLASDGPRHLPSFYDALNFTSNLHLGASLDMETNGIPGTAANSDDTNGRADEDGVTSFPTLATSATSYSLSVTVKNTTGTSATLSGWIDFNRNGLFDSGERAQATVANNATSATLTWSGLTGLVTSSSYVRLRIASNATEVAQPNGLAQDGEVEDYALSISDPTCSATLTDSYFYNPDFESYTSLPTDWSYPNSSQVDRLTNWHQTTQGTTDFWHDKGVKDPGALSPGIVGHATHLLPYSSTSSSGGAVGFIASQSTDYAEYVGQCLKKPLQAGKTYRLRMRIGALDATGSSTGGDVSGNLIALGLSTCPTTIPITGSDSKEGDAGYMLVGSTPINHQWEYGWRTVEIDLTPTTNTPYLMFGLSRTNLVSERDNAYIIVDELVLNEAACVPSITSGNDYSDAPATYGTPNHKIVSGIYLGANAPDSENAQPTPLDGMGDDATGTDDEDGVSTFPTLSDGATSYAIPAASIAATGTGTLRAWIDFDKNGAFTANEYTSIAVTNGTLAGPLSWNNVTMGSAGTTYARLRFTTTALTDNTSTTNVDERATLAANDGEVEDYAVTITQFAVCAPTTLQNALDGRLVQWTFNANEPSGAPANHLHAQLVNPTYITSGADVAFLNLGATQSNTATVITSNSIPATLPSNRYIDYRFTTSNFTNIAELYGFGMGIYADARPTYTYRAGAYNLRILLDTDPAFGSPITLINNLPIDDSQPSLGALKTNASINNGYNGYHYNHYQFDQVVTLLPNKTYYIRVYPFNVTRNGYDSATNNSSIVVFDDFGLKAAGCGSTSQITGKVFDDVNYGGNAGRPATVAGATGVNSAQVELYSSTGAYLTNTTTAADGTYSFTNLSSGSYYVRVVNSTVKSTRSGSDGTERGIQTYRTDGTNAVTNEVGGRKSALVDAAANTTNQTLNTTTFVLSGGGQAQSVQPVTISTSNISGVNFGFNFSTVVNTNDSGQGSLRQTILNANLLTNTGMAQPDSNYGFDTTLAKEVLVFNIPASSDPLGRADICGGTTCNITVNSKLPDITAPLIIDGTTQPGYVAGTPGVPRIRISPAAGLDAIGISIAYNAPDSTVRGLSITGFRTSNMNRAINVAAARTVVEANYLGLKPDGTADANGQGIMLEYADTATTIIGGTTPTKRNIISGNLHWGIAYDTGATAGTIQNNFIGTNVTGTAALGNQFGGIDLESANDTKVLDNVIAGNAGDGIQIGFTNGTILTSGYTIQGNRIGVGINSEKIGNTGPGIMNYGGSSNHQIGGTAAGQANVIANNLIGGIKLAASQTSIKNIISGNSIYANEGLGIDLGNDSITTNDANDTDSGANNLLNFPIISNISMANNNLTVQGCAPSGATVELFKADVSPNGKAIPGDNKLGKSKDYGEGQTYLASFVEGSASDSDATTCALAIDADGNNQAGMKAFSVTILAPAGFVTGDTLTATATLAASGTSEFSPTMTLQELASFAGNVFEDVNYGGGAGRAFGTAGTAGVNGARVELYNTSGAFVSSTATDTTGAYSFTGIAGENYYVRVVNDTVKSTRSGSDGTERGIQTYRTDGTNAVTNEVGGRKPALGDAAANTTNQTLNTTTFVLSGGGQAQSVQPVTISTSNISGVNFGFNFSTVVNTNDSGQGSLRQFILNASLLGNDSTLAQTGRTAGKENAILELITSDPNYNATQQYWSIAVQSELPLIGDNIIIDGSIQPARTNFTFANRPVIELNGTAIPKSTWANGLRLNGATNGSTIKYLAINRFEGAGIKILNSKNNLIEANNIGTDPMRTATTLGNTGHGIDVISPAGFSTITHNIIAYNAGHGITAWNFNGGGTANAATISNNSIYANGGLGIDLGINDSNSNVTLNDTNDTDTGANSLLNFPIISNISMANNNLTVQGCAPSGATVELFKADVSPNGKAIPGDNKLGKSKDYGEGQTYLTSFVEGSVADADTANCALPTDADGNNQTGMKAFSVTIPAPAAFVAGDTMTATATLASVGTSEFSPVFTYDASCKLVVITTADSDNSTNNSGSLRDAIECANATPGIDTISFNIPKTEAGFTNPDGVANSGDEYWKISLNSQLPSITKGVIIDGRTQTTDKGNTNSGNVATATTAGVDNIALPAVSAPEVEIVGQWFGAGFDIRASNVSIYNLGMRLFDTDIRMDQANTTGILFNGMALGVNPVDGSDPGNGQRSNQHLAVNASGVSFVLTNSILGYNDNKRGIVTGQYNNVSDISATISGNHFVGIGLAGNSENAAIEILRTQNPNITITGNRFIGRGAASATDLAIEFNDFGGGNTTCVNCRVENNTINGFHDGVGYFTDASLTGLIINKNRIYNNTEFAVFLGNVQNASIVQNYLYDNGKSGVLINKDPARGNIISQNSIYHNGEIGINLAGGNQIDPGGITLDDANDSDNGPNTLFNFPLFKVSGDTAATTLTLTGCAPAGSTVEIFEADVSPGGAATLGANKFGQSSDYGEGQTYLASFVEGSAADTDTSSCTLSTDSDGNNPSGLKAFSVTLPKPNTVTEGDLLTATATLTASGTSEFSPVATYTIPATLSGTIFDDVNYGGGAGRPLNADTSIKGVAGALLEVYSSSGLLTDKATTDNNGKFSITLPRNATYYLRVVSDSVNSSRSGSTGAELGIMTYRSAGGIGVTNEIGGRFPYRADAAANTSGATLNTNTGLFQGGALNGQPAQVVQPINLTASVANINIGFNFDTVVNANDSGQGSLRQVLLNANLLGNDANLTQTNRVNGKEAVIFALTTSDPNYNSTATTWTVPLVSTLPIITQPLVIDATTQAGFIDKPVIALDGSSTGNGDGLTLGAGSNGSLIQALAIHHSAGAGIGIVDSADNLIGGTMSGQGNVLISNQGDGIRVVGDTALNNSLLGNSINFNGGLGIDLGDDGVTANDALDADTGPNHFLNYPVVTFNGFGTNGTRILAYDLSLDAPVGNYRLEFFTSPTADASGYGEGQVFLGAKTISQPSAGSVSIRGTINTNQPVAAGAFISTTLTTQTASGFGSTSEFSVQKAGTNTSVCQDLTTNTGNQIVMVDENMQPLAMIKAKDSTGAYINYVISGGLDKNLFIINNPTPGATIDCSTITFVSLGTVSARSASTTGTTQAAKLPSIGNFEIPLDSNHDNIYEVQITATLASGEKVVRDLRYQVVNVNEAPVITSPTNVSITEHTGLKALTVATYDPDQPETLSFKISGGNDQNQFTIDAKTGDLSFRNEPDYESPTDANQDNVYSVEVTVTDAGGLSYAKTFIITVQNDTNDDGIVLSSKVLLQGAYDRKSGLMQATLNSLGLLPMQQPYQAAPFNYAGKEIRFKTTAAVTEPTSVVDWVLLELRNSKQEVVATKAALVQRNSVVVNAQTGAPLIPFTNVKPDNYYLNLRHRNHLGVMTQKPVAFSATPVEVDFTNPATTVKGSDNRLVAGSTALLWAGDLNGSQTLSASGPNNDITSMLNSVLTDEANTLAVTNWSLNRYDANDVNMDGRVLFTGPSNDANMLLGNILLHPQNSALASNFVIRGSLVQ